MSGRSPCITRRVFGIPSRTGPWILSAALLIWCPFARSAELLEFVRRPDSSARWEKLSDRRTGDTRVVEGELVSQTWRGFIWRHPLRITLPPGSAHPELAVLIIGGDGARAYLDEKELAARTGVTVALVRNVPNQPLFGQSEDALIAYTFEKYLATRDPEWPLLFPMTKAAGQAMDVVQELARQERREPPRSFVVTGVSKRGWTTWLTAVADRRVAGIVPVAFDNLNFGPQMENQLAVWGRYSNLLGDYTARALQALIGSERGRALVSMVDPYAYRDSLTRVPKLVINGSNDPYWELDAVNFYWPNLPGPKSLFCVPNAGHDAGSDPRAHATVAAFVERVAQQRPLPGLHWIDGSLPLAAVTSDEPPNRVRVWRAESPSRDFRGARWRSVDARREGDRFTADVTAPVEGFIAFFAEAEYPAGPGFFTVSTPVRISSPRQPIERRQ
jgi:PhoPQ-activated pathogenicity-related protein